MVVYQRQDGAGARRDIMLVLYGCIITFIAQLLSRAPGIAHSAHVSRLDLW
jgi:hypothetical protein